MQELERVILTESGLSNEEVDKQIDNLNLPLIISFVLGTIGLAIAGIAFLEAHSVSAIGGGSLAALSTFWFIKINKKWDQLEIRKKQLEKELQRVELVKLKGAVKLQLLEGQKLIEEETFDSDSPEAIEAAVSCRERMLEAAYDYNNQVPEALIEDELFELLKPASFKLNAAK